MKRRAYSTLAALGLMLAALGVHAQSPEEQQAPTLAEWEYDSLYEMVGLRANYMISEEVFGAKGEEIGNVEDAIINEQGQIVALIIEVGGFWELDDTNIVVPWKQVKLVPDGFKVPVTEANYEKYLLFGDESFVTMQTLQQSHPINEILATGAQTWKLTALVGDYVLFGRNTGYGYLSDVIFSLDGQIRALIVESSMRDFGLGTYAYPYNDFAWQPFDNGYVLPYDPEMINAMPKFDYGKFNAYWH